MTSTVETLLAVQEQDGVILELERRRAALAPRVLDLERARETVAGAATRARSQLEQAQARQAELRGRLEEHRALHGRNVQQFENAKRLREAQAASLQLEQARRFLAAEEAELTAVTRRIDELEAQVEQSEAALARVEEEQGTARAELDDRAKSVDAELAAVREERTRRAQGIEAPLLARYDKIHQRRKGDAVFPIRDGSCGACDTSLPMQRRNEMARTGRIEPCEACGVLLYAGS